LDLYKYVINSINENPTIPFTFISDMLSVTLFTTERKQRSRGRSAISPRTGELAEKHVYGKFPIFMDSPKDTNSKNRDSMISAPSRRTMADSQ